MERREDVRYEVDLPLAFSGSEIAGGGMVISLSKEGCAVRSEEAILRPYLLSTSIAVAGAECSAEG